jgi:hypothetical protein
VENNVMESNAMHLDVKDDRKKRATVVWDNVWTSEGKTSMGDDCSHLPSAEIAALKALGAVK